MLDFLSPSRRQFMSPTSLSSLMVLLSALFLLAPSSALRAEPAPSVRAVLGAPFDSVWEATLESLRDTGYRIRDEHRSRGAVTARRTRLVGRAREEEATQELRQITRREPHVGIDARGMSEYYVELTARLHPSGAQTSIDVVAKITAVFRRRGSAGAPRPVPLASSGYLERELVQGIKERLAKGTPAATPSQP